MMTMVATPPWLASADVAQDNITPNAPSQGNMLAPPLNSLPPIDENMRVRNVNAN